MRALVVADLHLDFWAPTGRHPLDALAPAEWDGLDLVILAGDLCNEGHRRWPGALAWIGERVDPERVDPGRVHVFPGNHDFYGGALDREDRLRDAAVAAGAGWAQMAAVVAGGRRFLCCTLWTDMALGGEAGRNARAAEAGMNDYRLIRVAADGHRRLRAADTVAVHRAHRRWLEDRLAEPFDGETVVVTHHAPHPAALAAPGGLGAAYASDLEGLIAAHRPALWLYGHTHVPADVTVGATRVRNVSVGYPPEADPHRAVGDPRAGLLAW